MRTSSGARELGKAESRVPGRKMNLDLGGNMQLGGVQLQQQVQSTEEQDRNDDGKIADQFAELEGTFREKAEWGENTGHASTRGGTGAPGLGEAKEGEKPPRFVY